MRLLGLVILLLTGQILFAQQSEITDEALEFLSEDVEGEIDFDTFLEKLSDYQAKPLNLNYASRLELEEFGLLSALQIDDFIEYRATIGKLVNIYELQAVPTFDLITIERIVPFVKVEGKISDFDFKGFLSKGKHVFFTRYQSVLQDQAGYAKTASLSDGTLGSNYEGSQYKLYTRYRYTYERNFSAGFTAEKDAGESFFQKSQDKGFDFYSAHVSVNNYKNLRHLVIGDYEVRLGQGLVAWSGLAFSKSTDVMNVKRKAYPIKPYTSVNEASFFRGAAASYQFNDFLVTLFASSKKVDSSIDSLQTDISNDDDIVVTSFVNSGFHRTANEIAKKNLTRQSNVGGSFQLQKGNWNVGLNAMYTKFGLPFTQRDNLYSQFFFSGDQQWNASLDYSYIFRNVHFFGETAINGEKNGDNTTVSSFNESAKLATVNGLLVSLHPKIDLSMVYRNIGRFYNGLFANAFTENSRANNERGFYLGWQVKPNNSLTLKGYMDLFRFPWLRFGIDAPSSGREQMLQVTYKPNRSLEIYARSRWEDKLKNLSGNETVVDQLVSHDRLNFRIQLRYKLNKAITLKSRIEKVRFKQGENPTERGLIVFQDLQYKPLSSPITFTGRVALFDTDSFNSRVYAFENDVLYSFSIPAFQGQGTRYYAIVKYRLNRNFDCWVRYAQTKFRDRETIGTGNEEIVGNLRSELKLQVRFKF